MPNSRVKLLLVFNSLSCLLVLIIAIAVNYLVDLTPILAPFCTGQGFYGHAIAVNELDHAAFFRLPRNSRRTATETLHRSTSPLF